MGDAAPNFNLRCVNNFLYVFLHGGHGEDTGYGGQPQKIRRVHTGNKTRTTDGGLCGLCADKIGNGGFVVFGVYCGVAEFDRRSNSHSRRIFRRDGVIDCRKRRAPHNETNRSDGRYAAL